MKKINDILNFQFQPAAFNSLASNVIPQSLNQHLQIKLQDLTHLRQKLGSAAYEFNESGLIPAIFHAFKVCFKTNTNEFDYRELRTLTYALTYSEEKISSIISSETELKYAINLFDQNWSDQYLFGLINCLLSNWDSQHVKSLEMLGNFIFLKLDNYSGSRDSLLSFKSNKRYYNTKNGDILLGDTIARLKQPIEKVSSFLNVPDSWLVYPYFSNVILAYYEREKDKINLDVFKYSIETIMNKHNSIQCEIKLIPKIVLQATERNYFLSKDWAKKIALDKLKDPQNRGESKWILNKNLSPKEIETIDKAKNILLQWMAEEFIEFFFKECINDWRRRQFWIKYAKNISTFKIVGSAYVQNLLLLNKDIKEFVLPRFITIKNPADKNSALMFVIKDYLFVEFSDAGAFYAYKLNNPSAPSIEAKSFTETSDLKVTSMDPLIYRTGFTIQKTNDEGKLSHRDGDMLWEDAATYWLNNIAGIYA